MPELSAPPYGQARPGAHAELLYQASLEFNSTLDVEELLPRLFDRILESLEAEAGSIWLRRGDELVCRIARGPAAERLEGLELPMGAGIVGDVALRGVPELVADARRDPRFIHQVDEATGFVTRSVLTAPLRAKGEVLGAFQVLNKRSGDGQFDEHDLALVNGLALTAGLALGNAQLHAVEKRARDFRALLGISREITSTLDIDRLCLTVVNLGSQALAYDRAAIGLYVGGSLSLKALSGHDAVDPKVPDGDDLKRLMGWLAERGAVVYVPDVAATEDDETAKALQSAFGDYLERSEVRSICLAPLQDEEGKLGVFYMESRQTRFLEGAEVEGAELLANQISVALRNAQLYDQVPLIGLLEPLAAWKRRVAQRPGHSLKKRLALAGAVLLALVVIPWPDRVTPRAARLEPAVRTPVRAAVGGLIAETMVREGERVDAGRVLAVLREDDVQLEIEEASGALAVARREDAAALARGDQTGAQVARIQAEDLEARLGIFEAQRARTRLTAPVSGVVLTHRPQERVGQWLRAGETFVVLGRVDRLEVESWVAQRDIERVRVGQPIRLRVPSLPQYTFVGTVTAIAAHADSVGLGEEPTFLVRAEISNQRDLLRPGMEARAKIVGPWRPIGWFLVRPFVRWIQLKAWR
jgi:RND family efflux transporter MFP subunit